MGPAAIRAACVPNHAAADHQHLAGPTPGNAAHIRTPRPPLALLQRAQATHLQKVPRRPATSDTGSGAKQPPPRRGCPRHRGDRLVGDRGHAACRAPPRDRGSGRIGREVLGRLNRIWPAARAAPARTACGSFTFTTSLGAGYKHASAALATEKSRHRCAVGRRRSNPRAQPGTGLPRSPKWRVGLALQRSSHPVGDD